MKFVEAALSTFKYSREKFSVGSSALALARFCHVTSTTTRGSGQAILVRVEEQQVKEHQVK